MNFEMAVKIANVIDNHLIPHMSITMCDVVYDVEYGFMVSLEFGIEVRSWAVNTDPNKSPEKISETKQMNYLIRDINGKLEKHAAGRSVDEIEDTVVLYWVCLSLQHEIVATFKNKVVTRSK